MALVTDIEIKKKCKLESTEFQRYSDFKVILPCTFILKSYLKLLPKSDSSLLKQTLFSSLYPSQRIVADFLLFAELFLDIVFLFEK